MAGLKTFKISFTDTESLADISMTNGNSVNGLRIYVAKVNGDYIEISVNDALEQSI